MEIFFGTMPLFVGLWDRGLEENGAAVLEQVLFELRPDEDIVNPIMPIGIPMQDYSQVMTAGDFARLQDRVGFYEPKIGLEVCDFLFAPTFMVGKKVISLFRSLAPEVETQALALFPWGDDGGQGINYWIPCLPPVNCLEKGQDGYCVHPEYMEGRDIVKHEGKREVHWLFSLAAAEKILSQGVMGVHFSIATVLLADTSCRLAMQRKRIWG